MITAYASSWVLPISSPPINNGAVAVADGKIIAVGPLAEIIDQLGPANVQIDDQGEAAILPGLVNVHSHLELTSMRGFLEDLPFHQWILKLTRTKYRLLSREDLLASALAGAAEAIKAGITTMADTCDSGVSFDALLISGQRGCMFQEAFGVNPADAEQSLNDLSSKIEKYRQRTTELVSVGISPHAPYTVSSRLFKLLTDYALRERLDVCIHAAESSAEAGLLLSGTGSFAEGYRTRGIDWEAPGCSTIAYLHRLGVLEARPLLVHCVAASEDDLDLIEQSRSRVAHCPKSNAKLGHGIAPLIKMRKRRISAGLGTDSVASNNTCDLIDEARFCCLAHRAQERDEAILKAGDVLEMATIGGAKALGLDERIGTLEPGKEADLIAVDLSQIHCLPGYDPADAIIYSCSARDVKLTVVAGNVLYRCGALKTLNEEELKQAIRELGKRITSAE